LAVDVLNADSTYKLLWKGYPVIIPAAADQILQIHGFGMCLCANEKNNDYKFLFKAMQTGLSRLQLDQLPYTISLMADAANAISIGFQGAFGGDLWTGVRGMCWFHVQQAFDHQLKSISNELKRDAIEADIYVLQVINMISNFIKF
jgi:hypothetical protein